MNRTPSRGTLFALLLVLTWLLPGTALAVAPGNDNFSSALPLGGNAGTTGGTNVDATAQNNEPDHAPDNTAGASVWWEFTPPANGFLMVDTVGSDFDTVMAVYTGGSLNNLTQQASNDDFTNDHLQSRVALPVTSGETYSIAVDGYFDILNETGNITLNWLFTTDNNDMLVDRIAVTTSGATGFNLSATKEVSEPNHGGNPGGKSVWWEFSAASTGKLSVDTLGSNFDTVLGIYEGDAFGPGFKTITGNDDHNFLAGVFQSSAALIVQAGHLYKIAVDGYFDPDFPPAESGFIMLNLSFGAATGNDLFASSTPIDNASPSGTVAGDNTGASRETDEPLHAGVFSGRSLWWHWQAPADGTLKLDTAGSIVDTVLAAYTGETLAGLALVAQNDDNGENFDSLIEFPVTAGTVYRIAVDGFDGEFGPVSLNWLFTSNSTRDDILVDFGTGTGGLWAYLNDSTWKQLHALGVGVLATGDIDESGKDDVVVVFPGFGTWVYIDNDHWEQVHAFDAEAAVIGDLNDQLGEDIILDFGPGIGIWVRYDNNNATWTGLHGQSPELMAVGRLDGGGHRDLIVDFGASGLWVWMNNASWVPLHPFSATHITTADIDDSGQDDVIVDFGPGIGIWVFFNNTNWQLLHAATAGAIATGDLDNNGEADVLVDFPGFGLWVHMNGANWIQLHGLSPELITTGNMDDDSRDEVIVDFGPGIGIWIFRNNTAWDGAPLHGLSPDHLGAVDIDGL
jgi:hypothetical protein